MLDDHNFPDDYYYNDDDFDAWLERTREGSDDYVVYPADRNCLNCYWWVSSGNGCCTCGMSGSYQQCTDWQDSCPWFDDLSALDLRHR